MGGLFGSSKPAAPVLQPLPEPPQRGDESVQAEARNRRLEDRRRRALSGGRASTILSSGSDEGAVSSKRTLLGE